MKCQLSSSYYESQIPNARSCHVLLLRSRLTIRWGAPAKWNRYFFSKVSFLKDSRRIASKLWFRHPISRKRTQEGQNLVSVISAWGRTISVKLCQKSSSSSNFNDFVIKLV